MRLRNRFSRVSTGTDGWAAMLGGLGLLLIGTAAALLLLIGGFAIGGILAAALLAVAIVVVGIPVTAAAAVLLGASTRKSHWVKPGEMYFADELPAALVEEEAHADHEFPIGWATDEAVPVGVALDAEALKSEEFGRSLAWSESLDPDCPYYHQLVGLTGLEEQAGRDDKDAAISSMARIPLPQNAVMAVLDSELDVELAKASFRARGMRQDDLQVFEGFRDTPIPTEGEEAKARSFVERFSRTVRTALMEEEPVLDVYGRERLAGKHVLAVPAKNQAQADDAALVLAAFGGHTIHRFGMWSIREMPVVAATSAEAGMAGVVELERFDLFRGLDPTDLAMMAKIARPRTFALGTLLAKQDEIGESIYLIQDGQVQLTTGSQEGEVTVRIAGPGESFPWAALVEPFTLITTATVMSDQLHAFEIPCRELKDLCAAQPLIGMRVYEVIAQILSGRYRNTLDRLVTAFDETLRDAISQPGVSANL